jgi:hypothetical protein
MKTQRRYFYKYKSLEAKNRQRTLRIISEGKIYFPKLAELNDPHDGKIFLKKSCTVQELKDLHRRLKENYGPPRFEIEDLIDDSGSLVKERLEVLFKAFDNSKDMFPEYGVLCLSETCTNPLMWAHYSEHTGICIEFDGTGTALQDPRMNRRIRYSRTYPVVKITDFAYGNKAVNKLLGTKCADWRYEREWRLIGSEGGKESDLPARISSVIFGLNTSSDDQKEIERIAVKAAIALKRVVLADKQYNFEVRDYE